MIIIEERPDLNFLRIIPENATNEIDDMKRAAQTLINCAADLQKEIDYIESKQDTK